ncbi:hypothetical protein ABU162_19700 [Paenibacillus thiaminolyticus]|uniref:hypothetical protein n=1 Tax=Paenibacillus thiaminolyticus TaxID=49283 RepID=UPI0035A59896
MRLGLTASGRLFQYLDIAYPADLNGPMFLSDDPVETGPVIKEGECRRPRVPDIRWPGAACSHAVPLAQWT